MISLNMKHYITTIVLYKTFQVLTTLYVNKSRFKRLLRMILFKLNSHLKEFFIRNFGNWLNVCMKIRNHFSCTNKFCLIKRFWNKTRNLIFTWMIIQSSPFWCSFKLTRCNSFYSLLCFGCISLLLHELKYCNMMLCILTLSSDVIFDNSEILLIFIDEPIVWSTKHDFMLNI